MDVTLSLAFYGLVSGDVSALHGEAKGITSDLHKDYKALVPACFEKKSGQWVYNKTKALALAEKYSVVFGKTTFEEFCNLVCLVSDKPTVEKTDVEKRECAIKSAEKALQKCLDLGVDKDALAILLKSVHAK